jgi:uncharacterized protein YbjT (DUF2867 family)
MVLSDGIAIHMKTLITGVTGNIGHHLYHHFRKHGKMDTICGAVSDVQRAKEKIPDIELRKLDFTNRETYEPALRNVNRLFLLRPPAIADIKKYIAPFLDVTKQKGVKHVVFLSLQGVENNPITPHHKIEKYILQIGIPYTFLRPSFFMENLTSTHRKEIIELSEIIVPAGKGKTNFVAAYDIAEVAYKALTEEGHLSKAYELTGQQAYNYYEVADMLKQELRRPISYRAPSIIRFISHRREYGDPWAFIAVMVGLYTVARFGKAAGYSDTIEHILNRKPILLSQFIRDNKEKWNV